MAAWGERLYGGAQYWRATHEFVMGAAQGLEDEEVSVEEIVNAMGVDAITTAPTTCARCVIVSSALATLTKFYTSCVSGCCT